MGLSVMRVVAWAGGYSRSASSTTACVYTSCGCGWGVYMRETRGIGIRWGRGPSVCDKELQDVAYLEAGGDAACTTAPGGVRAGQGKAGCGLRRAWTQEAASPPPVRARKQAAGGEGKGAGGSVGTRKGKDQGTRGRMRFILRVQAAPRADPALFFVYNCITHIISISRLQAAPRAPRRACEAATGACGVG